MGLDEVRAGCPPPGQHLPAQLHRGLWSLFERALLQVRESWTCCKSVTRGGSSDDALTETHIPTSGIFLGNTSDHPANVNTAKGPAAPAWTVLVIPAWGEAQRAWVGSDFCLTPTPAWATHSGLHFESFSLYPLRGRKPGL